MDRERLEGRRALVCGGSTGIGLACAQTLASRGAAVTLVARFAKTLEEACSTLPDRDRHSWVEADFSDPVQATESIEKQLLETGPVHILVNNSGGPKGGPLVAAAPEEFTDGLTAHVLASHRLVALLLPQMKEAGYGRIVNIISTSVKQPIPGLGVSNTIRGAMASWAKTLAGEVGPFGITVNNVLPGATRTRRLAALIQAKAERTKEAPEVVEKAMLGAIPLGRFAEADEVAAAVAFLASPEAGYITGINLPVDGGRTACL